MRALLHRLHEVWCALTSKCAVDPPDDAYVQWMKDQERVSIEARRERRANMVSARLQGDRRRDGEHDDHD